MTPPAPSPRRSWISWSLPLLGVTGFAAVWVMLGSYTGRQQSWMAVIAALDVAWMLRLGGWRPGAARLAAGVVGTSLVVLLANWGITASHLGAMLGLATLDSALRLGANHAWTLAQLANGAADAAWIVAALVVAAFSSR